MKTLSYSIFAVLCLLASPNFAQAAGSKPNIIVILADDLGWGDVGFNGNTEVPTPALDKLAESGVNFTAGYVTHPYCGPSRAGLMTGRYQQRFGFVLNPPFAPANDTMGLPEDEVTMASYLQKAGYHTGMIGKWHLGAAAPFHPLNRGFDYYFGFLAGGQNYFPAEYPDEDTVWKLKSPYYRNQLPIQRNTERLTDLEGYLTDIFSVEAADFVTRNKDNPFFLYLAYNAPHTPLEAKEEDIARFAHIKDKKKRIYSAMVYSLSEGIGKILDALEAAGVRDNTMVFFLSDNGGKKPWSNNGPLRGGKGDPYEGGIRVPFVLSWPDKIDAGSYDKPVSALDIMATALTAAGVTPDPAKPLDGVDLLPYVKGENDGAPHESIYVKRFYGGNQEEFAWGIRHGDMKLAKTRKWDAALFNLTSDLAEKERLNNAHPEKVKELQSIYDAWEEMHQPPPWGWVEGADYDDRKEHYEAARAAYENPEIEQP